MLYFGWNFSKGQTEQTEVSSYLIWFFQKTRMLNHVDITLSLRQRHIHHFWVKILEYTFIHVEGRQLVTSELN